MTKQRYARAMGGKLCGAVLMMAGVLQCQVAAADDKSVIEYRQQMRVPPGKHRIEFRFKPLEGVLTRLRALPSGKG